jgi:predicted membrane-bound mannosyltransferase
MKQLWETLSVGADTFWSLSGTAWTGIYTLLTAGLLAVAVVAAVYARGQWASSRAQIHEARNVELEARRPYVIVTVEPTETSRHLFDLVVRNIGQRPAQSVLVRLDPPPVSAVETAGYELSKAKMLTEPVAMIAPGQVMRAFYDSHIDRNGQDHLPTSHKVSLSYQDSTGHTYNETSVIDIDAMKGTMFTDVKTVHDIAKSLAEIQETLARASVLHRRGTLEVEASVEGRAELQKRLAREQAEAREKHEALVRRLRPNGVGNDEADGSA